MAKSLSRIMDQIEKLQKEAAAIQSTVITRIKREIAQHGLTAEHLFGSSDSTAVGNGRNAAAKAAKAPAAKKPGAEKPAKYADDQGNGWHGIGKRPSWIHAALNAGRSLEEFLVGAKKAAPVVTKARAAAKAAPRTAKKVAAKKKAAKPTKAAVAAKPAAKAPAKKAAKAAPVKKAAVKKPSKATPAAAVEAGQANA